MSVINSEHEKHSHSVVLYFIFSNWLFHLLKDLCLFIAGGNTMVLHLWGDQAASPQHSLHFGFGVGSIISPLLARPFLSQKITVNVTNYTDKLNDVSMELHQQLQYVYNKTEANTTMVDIMLRESNLMVPYGIGSSFVLLIAISFLVSYILGPPHGFPTKSGTTNVKQLFNPATCGYGHPRYGGALIFLIMIYFTFVCGSEHSYGRFLFSYAIEADVNFTKDEAALLNSVFWAMFTIGRGGGTVVAKFMRISLMIWIEFVFVLLSITTLAIWGFSVKLVLWIASCSYALMLGPIFPGGISWANLQLDLNSMAVMVIMIGCSSGSMLYIYISGYFFQYMGPHSMMYIQVALIGGLGLVFAPMELVGRQLTRVRISEAKHQECKVREESKPCIESNL